MLGIYEPGHFSFAKTDAAVPNSTKSIFKEACLGFEDAYRELREGRHLEALSVEMQITVSKLPGKYDHYHSNPRAPIRPADPSPVIDLVRDEAQSSVGVRSPAKRTSIIAKTKQQPVGRTANAAAAPTAVRAHSEGVRFNYKPGFDESFSDSDGSVYTPSKDEMRRKRKRYPTAKAAENRTKKLHHGRGSSVFGHRKLGDIPGSLALAEIQNAMRNCKDLRGAFTVALRAYFSYQELKGALPTQIDVERLQVAAALARDFIEQRGEPLPTSDQLYRAFTAMSKSIKP